MCDVSKVPCFIFDPAEVRYYRSTATAVRSSKGTSNVEIPVASKPHMPVSYARVGQNIKVIIYVARYASRFLSNTRHFS